MFNHSYLDGMLRLVHQLWILFGCRVIGLVIAVHYGYGKRSKDISREHQITVLKWFFCAKIVYKILIVVNNISFLCLYPRMFLQPFFGDCCYLGFGIVSL
jgi:hypothetical protein